LPERLILHFRKQPVCLFRLVHGRSAALPKAIKILDGCPKSSISEKYVRACAAHTLGDNSTNRCRYNKLNFRNAPGGGEPLA
jgi:hypothetical protein